MSGNRGVVYLGDGKVEVRKIDYPKCRTRVDARSSTG